MQDGKVRLDEILNLLSEGKEKPKKKSGWGKVLKVLGIIALCAAVAVALYRFFAPDYAEDFEDDFDEDFDEFFEDDKEEPQAEDKEDDLDLKEEEDLVTDAPQEPSEETAPEE